MVIFMYTRTVVIFIGPAGSGKSTTVNAYAKWVKEVLGYSSYKVNLDPATEYIPYEPDYDIRTIINAHKIAKELGLGPNGALVVCMDMITNVIEKILKSMINNSMQDTFILIDTPGQMEVFLFRDIAYDLVNILKKFFKNVVALFIVAADTIKRYEDYVFLAIISIAIQTRLGVDVIPVINKIDVTLLEEIVGDIISDIEIINNRLKNLGLYGEMLKEILNIISLYSKATRVPKISAKNFIGMEELHRVIHEVTCSCGDLT